MDTMVQNVFGGFSDIALVVLLVSAVGAVGVALGEFKVRGVGLGVGGVLFAGIAFGHFGADPDPHLLHFLRDFGLILFVYTIGIQVGPGFFQALRRSGLRLNALAVSVVLMSAGLAVWLGQLCGLSLPATLGLLSGAVTNTPSLAAGQQMLTELGMNPATLSVTGTAYAIAYPFGIAGTILAIVLVRLLLRLDPAREAEVYEEARRREAGQLDGLDLSIQNHGFQGVPLKDISVLQWAEAVVSRLRRGEEVIIPTPETTLQVGDWIHVVGPREKLQGLVHTLGEQEASCLTMKDTAIRVEKLVVTNTAMLGKTIAQTGLYAGQCVVITRVTRAGVDLSPLSGLKLQFGDLVTVVGHPDDIAVAAEKIGNARHRLEHLQVFPIFFGLALGVLLGSVAIHLPGMPVPLKLGLAGGPLIVAILLSRLGHLGPYVWFMPGSAMHGLRELGIVMFLAAVGLSAGDTFVATLTQGDGLLWFGVGALVTLVPLLVAGVVGRLVLRLNYLTLSGVLAGSMTDPPALAFATTMSRTDAPALAYATVYPLTMCLRILIVQVIGLALWAGV